MGSILLLTWLWESNISHNFRNFKILVHTIVNASFFSAVQFVTIVGGALVVADLHQAVHKFGYQSHNDQMMISFEKKTWVSIYLVVQGELNERWRNILEVHLGDGVNFSFASLHGGYESLLLFDVFCFFPCENFWFFRLPPKRSFPSKKIPTTKRTTKNLQRKHVVL